MSQDDNLGESSDDQGGKGMIRIINADVMDGLRQLPDKSVQCVVTSPPYWSLRQYFFEGAVIIKRSLTEEQSIYLISELNKIGVRPKYGGER